jgi:hypothetical protein
MKPIQRFVMPSDPVTVSDEDRLYRLELFAAEGTGLRSEAEGRPVAS